MEYGRTYYVRVYGVLVGKYNTWQVAMNHAEDLFADGDDAEVITINGISLKILQS